MNPDRLPAIPDRRSGTSDLERAAALIEHAICYLVTEQYQENIYAARAHSDAIAILGHAAGQITQFERREPAQRSTVTLVRSLFLAEGHKWTKGYR